MKRVTGIGGIFFKSDDPESTQKWYRNHLGIKSGEYGGTFEWRHVNNKNKKGYTAWSIFPEKTEYLNPSNKDFMVNYRVDDLETLLGVLKEEGVEVVGEMQEFEYGKFGWIMDPNGIKIELWEANDEAYAKMGDEDSTNKSS
jgi:predicted enzyme related to lactoylglutathione lyase